jgi:hypothetical protein
MAGRAALDGGGDVAGAYFLFGQVFFVHKPFVPPGWSPSWKAQSYAETQLVYSLGVGEALGSRLGLANAARLSACPATQRL